MCQRVALLLELPERRPTTLVAIAVSSRCRVQCYGPSSPLVNLGFGMCPVLRVSRESFHEPFKIQVLFQSWGFVY